MRLNSVVVNPTIGLELKVNKWDPPVLNSLDRTRQTNIKICLKYYNTHFFLTQKIHI